MPIGRILLKSISESKKLARLKTDSARLLYSWLIPQLDINGCFSGDAEVVKGKIFTRLKKSNKTVEGYLQDLERVKLIIRYEVNGDIFLHNPTFVKKQPSLNPKKEGKPHIPLPPPELLQSYSGQSQEKPITSKVKESKSKGKERKGKDKVKKFDQLFEKFWTRYPRKEHKLKAKEKYIHLIKVKKVDPQKIEDALSGYINVEMSKGTERQYLMYAKTFLYAGKKGEKGTWEEYIPYADPKYKNKPKL